MKTGPKVVVVTAAYGLASGVVDSECTTDSWRVAPRGTILTRTVAEKDRMHVRAPGAGTIAVAIDGNARGWTPLAAVKLPVGTHEVQCFPSNGKAHSMTVTVAEGMMSKFRFDLGDAP